MAEQSSHIEAYPQLSGLVLRGDLNALHRELIEEAAHSLGNTARRLEASLELLGRLAAELGRVGQDGDGRAELVARFNAQRDEVLLRLHYLRIQREALGLFRHEELDRHYPVPAKMR